MKMMGFSFRNWFVNVAGLGGFGLFGYGVFRLSVDWGCVVLGLSMLAAAIAVEVYHAKRDKRAAGSLSGESEDSS